MDPHPPKNTKSRQQVQITPYKIFTAMANWWKVHQYASPKSPKPTTKSKTYIRHCHCPYSIQNSPLATWSNKSVNLMMFSWMSSAELNLACTNPQRPKRLSWLKSSFNLNTACSSSIVKSIANKKKVICSFNTQNNVSLWSQRSIIAPLSCFYMQKSFHLSRHIGVVKSEEFYGQNYIKLLIF